MVGTLGLVIEILYCQVGFMFILTKDTFLMKGIVNMSVNAFCSCRADVAVLQGYCSQLEMSYCGEQHSLAQCYKLLYI